MEPTFVYKEAFTAIGKMAEGPANASQTWILPLWSALFDNLGRSRRLFVSTSMARPPVYGG